MIYIAKICSRQKHNNGTSNTRLSMSIIITNPDSSNPLMTKLKDRKHIPLRLVLMLKFIEKQRKLQNNIWYIDYRTIEGPTKSDAKITEPTNHRHWNAANHPHWQSTNHAIVAMFLGTNETETRKQYDFHPIRSSSAMIKRAAVWIGFWRVSPTALSEGFENEIPRIQISQIRENSDFTSWNLNSKDFLEPYLYLFTGKGRIVFYITVRRKPDAETITNCLKNFLT